MTKAVIGITISAILIILAVLMFFNGDPILGKVGLENLIFLLVAVFGAFVAIRRIRGIRKGQPGEDELSKKIRQKASSVSFYISLYIWLLIMLLSDRLKQPSDVLFGWGIMGMALVFVLSWIYYNFRGIKE